MSTPPFFLDVRVHRLDTIPGVTGLCVGYESGSWRDNQLINNLMKWLPDFALNHTEKEAIDSASAVEMIVLAARNIFLVDNPYKRGEFGELLLHIVTQQCFGTIPAISKIYFKDGPNETVKGFDSVHVLVSDNDLELWLGEVKFYENISMAISHVVKELATHTEKNYLREEFQAITRKIDSNWPYAKTLKTLISSEKSLDYIFDRICIPVLLTYNSPCVATHTELCDEYKANFLEEIQQHHLTFSKKELPSNVRVHLFLLPLKNKAELVQKLHERLRLWQSILES